MKFILLLFTAMALLVVGCSTTSRIPKWEYKQVAASVGDDTLNKYGNEGWIVVCVGNSETGSFYLLKRLKD